MGSLIGCYVDRGRAAPWSEIRGMLRFLGLRKARVSQSWGVFDREKTRYITQIYIFYLKTSNSQYLQKYIFYTVLRMVPELEFWTR